MAKEKKLPKKYTQEDLDSAEYSAGVFVLILIFLLILVFAIGYSFGCT